MWINFDLFKDLQTGIFLICGWGRKENGQGLWKAFSIKLNLLIKKEVYDEKLDETKAEIEKLRAEY
jgi:hypothetical protein